MKKSNEIRKNCKGALMLTLGVLLASLGDCGVLSGQVSGGILNGGMGGAADWA